MKITIHKLIETIPAIQKVTAADLTMKCHYWVNKMAKMIDSELEQFNESNRILREKYRDPKITDAIVIADENKEIYVKEYTDLMDIEIELNFAKPIIFDSENIRLSVNDVNALADFITFVFEEDMNQEENKND